MQTPFAVCVQYVSWITLTLLGASCGFDAVMITASIVNTTLINIYIIDQELKTDHCCIRVPYSIYIHRNRIYCRTPLMYTYILYFNFGISFTLYIPVPQHWAFQ